MRFNIGDILRNDKLGREIIVTQITELRIFYTRLDDKQEYNVFRELIEESISRGNWKFINKHTLKEIIL